METTSQRRRSPRSAKTPLGSTVPRLWTPELRDLSEPGASYGPRVVKFARTVLKVEPTPAQQWLYLHAGEYLEDNLTPRFRRVLTVQGRQAGKTTGVAILDAYWLFVEKHRRILGLSTDLATATEAWEKVVDWCDPENEESIPALAKRVKTIRRANDGKYLETTDRCRYLIKATGRKGGRGFSLPRLVIDELREHYDWKGYNAAYPTLAAQPRGQAWFLSNMGGDEAVVLHSLRDSAIERVDPRLGIFEWSAPEDCDPQDPEAWAMANPNLGIHQDVSDLEGSAAAAVLNGGDELAGFLTERLCIRVKLLNPAVDPRSWGKCKDPGTLDAARERLYGCLDVSLDELHATFAVAALLPDGRVRVEVVASWEGRGYADDVAKDLPALLERVKPKTLGWLATGPAASLTPTLRRKGGWPGSVAAEEIRSDLPAVCMSFASLVDAQKVAHSGQQLLDNHAGAAEKLRSGDRWVFSRKGAGGVDALYAVAGAAFLAQSGPVKLRTVLPSPIS